MGKGLRKKNLNWLFLYNLSNGHCIPAGSESDPRVLLIDSKLLKVPRNFCSSRLSTIKLPQLDTWLVR